MPDHPTAAELLEEVLEAMQALDVQTHPLPMSAKLRAILADFVTSPLWDDVRACLGQEEQHASQ